VVRGACLTDPATIEGRVEEVLSMRRRPLVLSLTSVAGVAVLVVGAVVVYVQLLRDDAPPPLGVGDRASELLGDASTPSTTSPADVPPADDPPGAAHLVEATSGTWVTTDDCIVGYRVVEDFAGGLQNAEAVGRTTDVVGIVEVEGETIRAASFTADVSTLRSDDRRRDRQVRDRLLDTDTWPTATFTLSGPVALDHELADGDQVEAVVTGTLTLRDLTRPVSVAVTAIRTGDEVQLLGAIDVVFADWGIPAPTNPLVSVRDHGMLEFSLWLTRAP
jgi:polyisoprenoid-binding protein YceI